MKTLREYFDSYQAAVTPGAEQESRRAFIAGAAAVLHVMDEITADGVPLQQGASVLDGLHRECHDFARRVELGRA